MGIVRSQDDSWTKEMAKHESRPVFLNGTYIEPIPISAGGHKDWPFQPYPKMLYKAESADGGPRICGTKVVEDEAQERMAIGSGWSDGQEAALERVDAQQLEFAKLAANRAYNEQWMSGKAKAEAAAVDETTMQHLPAIPETPIRRHGVPVGSPLAADAGQTADTLTVSGLSAKKPKRKYERKAKPSKTAEG